MRLEPIPVESAPATAIAGDVQITLDQMIELAVDPLPAHNPALERELAVLAWRRAMFRPWSRPLRTTIGSDDGRPVRVNMPPNWTRLGEALRNRRMIEHGAAFGAIFPREAEAAIKRLRGGWCHHPKDWIIRGRGTNPAGYCLILDDNADRILRFDECQLCGWRFNPRISHVPERPSGAPPWPQS